MARVDEEKLNFMNATAQDSDVAARLAATPVVVRFVVDEDATGELTIPIPYDMYIIDVIVQCNDDEESGTLTLKKDDTAITDAITCDTNHAVERAGTLDDDETSIGPDDTVTVDAAGSGDRGTIYILGMRY